MLLDLFTALIISSIVPVISQSPVPCSKSPMMPFGKRSNVINGNLQEGSNSKKIAQLWTIIREKEYSKLLESNQ